MRISKSAIALAVAAALPALSFVGSSDADAASKLAIGKRVDPQHATPHFKYPHHSRAAQDSVLYDQSGIAADGFPSQNFESSYDAYDSAGADDFVVSDAAGWSVGAFNFQIAMSPGGDPSSATYDVNVYADGGNGLPAASTACAYSAVAGAVDGTLTSLSVSLPTPCELAQGTYWVSVVANLDYAVGGQLFWALSTQAPAPGSNAVFENPGGAFGACSSWTDNAVCGAGGGLTTALFQVVGSVGATAVCDPNGICLTSTVGTDLSPAACGTADTIDATVGDQLNFCYTLTNNSNVELDYHSLANNIDGSIFNLSFAPLPPGASLQDNEIRTVASTATYNTTWTAQDVPPGYTSEVTGGGGCGDRIFADGFGDSPSACGGNFVEISGTGAALGLGDDASADVAMPFSFKFYGTTSNLLSVGNNGGILFGASGGYLDYVNTSLPAASFGAPAILPLWDDFDSTSGDVYTDVRGSAPNRQFIVEWYNRVHFFDNTDPATFEVIFNESDGSLQFEYLDVAYTASAVDTGDPAVCDGGVCATIGLQNSASIFNQFSAFQAAVTDGSGILWTPSSPQVFTSTDSVTVNVGAPQIVVNPSALTGSVAPGATTVVPFAVENHGDRDLDWSLTEAAPSTFHFAPPGARFVMPMGDPSTSTIARAPFAGLHSPRKGPSGATVRQPLAGATAFAANVYDDAFQTFDVTADNGIDTVGAAQGTAFAFKFLDADFSKAYGIDKFGSMAGTFASISSVDGAITPIGNPVASADSDGWTGFAQDPTTGTLYASATTCGSSSHLYTIDRNTGDATLVGELTGMPCAIWIAIGPDGLMYSVDITNDALYAVDKTSGATSLKGSVGFNTNYGQDADFDQSTGILYWAAFNADAGEDEIRTIDLDTGATSLVYSLGVTQVVGLATETSGGPCFQPQDLPWLSLAPLTGTTPPLGSSPVSASIDATNANDGDVLAGTVCATSNDPANHIVGTPITVDVTNAAPMPPTVTKAFAPTTVSASSPSTLTITLGNANNVAATLSSPLTDAFPTGLVIAPTPNAATTCGGALTAVAGADSVVLDNVGASIPPAGICTISVDVAAAAGGSYANDIPAGALQTSAGSNGAPADATLQVLDPPTLSKAFAPAQVDAGVSSTLTITLTNPNNAPIALAGSLTDSFPQNLFVAPSPNATTTCGGTVTAAAGDGSVTLDGAGATIPAAGSCTVSVDVDAVFLGAYVNTIPAGTLQTEAGANAAPASATLTVATAPTLDKVFVPATMAAGQTSQLTINIGNVNPLTITTSAALADALPPGMVVAAAPNASTTCGGVVTASAGADTVTLASGASIAAGGCFVSVDVTAAAAGTYPNTIAAGALQTDAGSNAAPAAAVLTVTP